MAQYFPARMAGFFGALFLVYGASLPYLSVLLDARGLDAGEIGLVTSVPLLLRLLLTPAIALRADRSGDHRGAIIVMSSLALAAVTAVAFARGFWPLLLCVAGFQVALQSIMPLAETIALVGVKRGHDYGRMRLGGSVTFILVTFVGAWAIERGGPEMVPWLLVVTTAITVGAALLLPGNAAPNEAGRRPGLDVAAALRLVTSRPIVLFLIAAGAVQSAHAVIYTFGVLHWRALEVRPNWIGFLWSIGVVAEIALFWWSAAVLRWVTAVDLICIGALAAVLRWTMMAFDPPLAVLVPLQAAHGLTYGASHLGAMHFLKAQVAEQQAGTAQALYSISTGGIGMGLSVMLAGFCYRYYGGASYFAMAIVAAVGLIAGVLLRRCERTLTLSSVDH